MLHVPVLLSLRECPKLDKLSAALGMEHNAVAVGYLVNLWLWGLAQEIPADGALPQMVDVTWGKVLGCPRSEAMKAVAALEATGWLDRDGDTLCIHDWHDHAGGVLIARESEREYDRRRKAEARRSEAETARKSMGSAKVRPDSDRTKADSGLQSNPTQAIQSNQSNAPAAGAASDPAFDAFYARYPRKKQRKDALKAWRKLTAEERAHAERAVVDFAAQCEAMTPERRQFIPYPASWLNAGAWDDSPDAAPPKPRPKPNFDGSFTPSDAPDPIVAKMAALAAAKQGVPSAG